MRLSQAAYCYARFHQNIRSIETSEPRDLGSVIRPNTFPNGTCISFYETWYLSMFGWDYRRLLGAWMERRSRASAEPQLPVHCARSGCGPFFPRPRAVRPLINGVPALLADNRYNKTTSYLMRRLHSFRSNLAIMTFITGISHVNLSVPEGTLDQAKEFYGGTLVEILLSPPCSSPLILQPGFKDIPVPAAQRGTIAW